MSRCLLPSTEQISDEEAVSDDDESSAGGTKVESPRISTTHGEPLKHLDLPSVK